MNKEESGSIPVPTTGEALHAVQDSAAPAVGSKANEQLMDWSWILWWKSSLYLRINAYMIRYCYGLVHVVQKYYILGVIGKL